MIRLFLRERLSWLVMFVAIQLMMPLIAYIDPDIPMYAAWYTVLLSSLLFILFLIWRYQQETRYFSDLQTWNAESEPQGPAEGDSPFEQIVGHTLQRQTRHDRDNARQLLHRLEQEHDDLLAWIHEVKTPLSAMRLMIERLSDTQLQRQLHSEWLRIHYLLDQQLHQKRMLHIQNDLFIEPVDLASLLHEEIRGLRAWCMNKDIGFDIALQIQSVHSDAKWLGFMLRQLLTNAVKYSQSSDIRITSREQGDHAVLEIADQGCGIDPRDMPRIFDKGFTSTNRRQDNAATGMGLYLLKQTAHWLQIQIEVESQLEAGTTFRLLFPRANTLTRLSSM